MDYRDIISMLDAEIGRLEEAGRLLKQGGKVDAAIPSHGSMQSPLRPSPLVSKRLSPCQRSAY
jgi:hypothetical protein